MHAIWSALSNAFDIRDSMIVVIKASLISSIMFVVDKLTVKALPQ